MIILILFAFIAGIVTILSPCVLPILPIILSSSIGNEQIGKVRPLGVITGFILSFTFFTLFLSSIVKLIGVPADSLRIFSIIVIGLFGASMLIPKFQVLLEILFSKLSQFLPRTQNKTGFGGGVVIGLSLGLLWTPCVGPILASVISLAITGTVNLDAFVITLAYSIGTAIPMFFIMIAGQSALRKVPWLLQNSQKIQQGFGILMILTAVAIFFNLDRNFQTFILQTFPNYGSGLTRFEDIPQIQNSLKNLSGETIEDKDTGKPMFEIMNKESNLAPELIPGGDWFNTDPLTLESLRGKVVLIDFWTYTCINCQRTLPYLKNWWDKYKDQGLIIIGVHSPEFEFEKNPENLSKAIKDFNLSYPIVQDNDFSTWRSYKNRYWPAKYLIDKNGNIRYTHFGEGAYNETEKTIQDLLAETGTQVSEEINNPEDENFAKTPELYLGYKRIQYLASPESLAQDTKSIYSRPNNLPVNKFAFSGEWEVMNEYASPSKNSSLYLNFESREVFLVMRPKIPSKGGTVKIFVDDNPVSEMGAGGVHVINSKVEVNSDKLYKLIKLEEPGQHILRIEFEDSNLELYAFTFG